MINEFELTPPMGWYSGFNTEQITETTLLDTISYISQYLKDFGYQYVILDDAWYASADITENGFCIPTAEAFSSAENKMGFKILSDYIHSLKLKFGLYLSPYIPSSAITQTCYLPNSKICVADIVKSVGDHYVIDFDKYGAINYYIELFKLYAAWGIDLIRVDLMHFKYTDLPYLHNALKYCGRTILLEVISPIIPYSEMDTIKRYANIWPISDSFSNGWKDLLRAFELCKMWNPSVKVENWPKLPFIASTLQERFTPNEQMSLITLCSIFKSPIILDGNFKELPESIQSLLTNMDVLSLLRHSHAAYELYHTSEHISWISQGADGARYLAIFNISEESFIISTSLQNLNLTSTYTIYDLWHHENLEDVINTFDLEVPPHGVRLIKLIKK